MESAFDKMAALRPSVAKWADVVDKPTSTVTFIPDANLQNWNTKTTNTISSSWVNQYSFVVNGQDNKWTVKILPDGKVEYTGTLEQASKTFWDAVSMTYTTENAKLKNEITQLRSTVSQTVDTQRIISSLRTVLGVQDGESIVDTAMNLMGELAVLRMEKQMEKERKIARIVAILSGKDDDEQEAAHNVPAEQEFKSYDQALSFKGMNKVSFK